MNNLTDKDSHKGDELQWAAGFLSALGTFMAVNRSNGEGKVATFVMLSSNHPEGVKKFADIMGLRARRQASPMNSIKVNVSGKPLHQMMISLWPYLPKERKQDYARVVKIAKEKNYG